MGVGKAFIFSLELVGMVFPRLWSSDASTGIFYPSTYSSYVYKSKLETFEFLYWFIYSTGMSN